MDMRLNSKFDRQEIDKEREVIKEELAMYQDQPQQYVQELLNELQWPNQPLGRSITGTESTLATLDRRQMLRFLRENYLAANSLVVAAGRVQHGAVVKAVARYAPHFQSGRPAPFPAAVVSQDRPQWRLCRKPIEQTQLVLGIRTCSRHDERRYALRLLNTLLGENSSSRLFQSVREEHGLAYSISSSLSFFADVGDLVIAAGLDTEKLESTLRLVMSELRRFIQKAPGVAEVRQAKDYVIGQIDLSLENTENHMLWLGEQLLGYGIVLSAQAVKQRLEQVTPGAIHAVARDFFRPERLNLALVGPRRKGTGLDRLLSA
jgi:predicted Zn-dependent peptidase